MKWTVVFLASVLFLGCLKTGLMFAADKSSSLLLPGNPLEGTGSFLKKVVSVVTRSTV